MSSAIWTTEAAAAVETHFTTAPAPTGTSTGTESFGNTVEGADATEGSDPSSVTRAFVVSTVTRIADVIFPKVSVWMFAVPEEEPV